MAGATSSGKTTLLGWLLTLILQKDVGLFGNFGSFPVTLRAQATGKSEVYWKQSEI